MKTLSKMLVASAMTVLASSNVLAQNISFTTQGTFGGTCPPSGPLNTAVCALPGATLTYNTQGQQDVLNQGTVDFGTFQTSGVGPQNFAGATFTLHITQILPAGPVQNIGGSVTGTIQALQGGLVWVPNATNFVISGVTYQIFTDVQTGGVAISAPGAGGVPGNLQSIRGSVSIVPEPSTYLLMAAGLGGLGVMARRRRKV